MMEKSLFVCVCASIVTVIGQSDRVIFNSGQSSTSSSSSGGQTVTSGQVCETVGGPSKGEPCVFPFIFGGVRRDSCITDEDPEGRAWCSTLVDTSGVHVKGGGHWAHCGSACPGYLGAEGGQAVSSAFTVETSSCQTSTGEQGICRIPSTCVGASLAFIDSNPCNLPSGDVSDLGVCCMEISNNNVRAIVDTPAETVPIPSGIKLDVANDIFERFGGSVGQNTVFASEEAASDVVKDTNFVDDTSPTEFHLRFNSPRDDIVRFDQSSQDLLEVTKRLKSDNNLTDEQASIGLRNSFNSDTSNEINKKCPWTPAPRCDSTAKYRSVDGRCNNLKNPNFGRTGTPFQRILLPEYAKGSLDLPRRSSVGSNFELPSAREVSNLLSGGPSAPEDNSNTVLVMQMGQFIDHDITHTPNHGIQCCGRNGVFPASFDAEKCSPIRISNTDPFWRGRKTCMNFARSLSSPSLNCGLQSREQLNQITHWLDGSNIYGSTDEEASYLRTRRFGQMKVTRQGEEKTGGLPSCAAEPAGKVKGCDVCGGRKKDCFFAGDFRVNEQLNLIVLHTLFMREHNRLATELFRLNPRWSDEKLFQEARKINIAEYQHVLFKEWLPIIIGTTFMKIYGLFPLSSGFSQDYSDSFDPRINNEFAAAAYRFGHSMIPTSFSSISKGRRDTTLNMRELFFKPGSLKTPGFLDGLVRGMSEQGSGLWDSVFIEDIRNHLFESSPGRGGLDLVAVNIQRGRDHGIPGYNKFREICVGKKADWTELRKSFLPKHITLLRQVYKSVDDIDLYVGGFLEAAHEDSILGPVFKCIIGDQFARLKKGDRYFYDLGRDRNVGFTLPQLDEIRKTSMSRIICDNTDGVDRMQPLAFKMPTSRANAVRLCTEPSIPEMNLAVFRETSSFGR